MVSPAFSQLEERELLAGDVDGDVAHGDVADTAREGAAMGMAVENEVWPVRADRRGKPAGAEEGPDRLGLADERVADGGVMEQHDAAMAACDLLQPRLDSFHLGCRFAVHLAQERLAEVGQLRAGEASDEALRPDDADVHVSELDDHRLARQDANAALLEDGCDLVCPAGVMVVVAEHGEY